MAFAIEKQTIFTTILSKLLFKKRSPVATATCCLQSDRTVIYLHLPLSVNDAKNVLPASSGAVNRINERNTVMKKVISLGLILVILHSHCACCGSKKQCKKYWGFMDFSQIKCTKFRQDFNHNSYYCIRNNNAVPNSIHGIRTALFHGYNMKNPTTLLT